MSEYMWHVTSFGAFGEISPSYQRIWLHPELYKVQICSKSCQVCRSYHWLRWTWTRRRPSSYSKRHKSLRDKKTRTKIDKIFFVFHDYIKNFVELAEPLLKLLNCWQHNCARPLWNQCRLWTSINHMSLKLIAAVTLLDFASQKLTDPDSKVLVNYWKRSFCGYSGIK